MEVMYDSVGGIPGDTIAAPSRKKTLNVKR